MNNATIKAVRAIAAEQINRVVRIALIITVILFVASGIMIAWLSAEFSPWWLVAGVPLLVLGSLLSIALSILWAIAFLIIPRQLSRDESKQIRGFMNRLVAAAASAQVSRFTLAFMIIRDALQGRRFNDRLQSVVDEGRGLHADFLAIQKMF